MNPTTFQEILQAIELGLAVFAQIWKLFNAGMPVTAAPALLDSIVSTPGLTEPHKSIITNAVNMAVKLHV